MTGTDPPDPGAAAFAGTSAARPAPRLSPDERIAGLISRVGRFARIDPATPGTLPSWPQVAGVAAWAAFTAGCGVAAWRRHRR